MGEGLAAAEAVLLVEIERRTRAPCGRPWRKPREERAALGRRGGTALTAASAAGDSGRFATPRARSSRGLPEDRRSLQVIEDGCVPLERIGEYIRVVRRVPRHAGSPS